GADHGFIQVDVLDLDIGDLHAPGGGVLIEHLLDGGVELVPLRKQLVHLVLARDRTQRSLRELTGRLVGVHHLQHGLLGIDDTEVDHGADLDRDVVARDHVLLGHVQHHGAQLELAHVLHGWQHQAHARTFHAGEPAKGEHHAALIFLEDAQRAGDQYQHDDDDDDQGRIHV